MFCIFLCFGMFEYEVFFYVCVFFFLCFGMFEYMKSFFEVFMKSFYEVFLGGHFVISAKVSQSYHLLEEIMYFCPRCNAHSSLAVCPSCGNMRPPLSHQSPSPRMVHSPHPTPSNQSLSVSQDDSSGPPRLRSLVEARVPDGK